MVVQILGAVYGWLPFLYTFAIVKAAMYNSSIVYFANTIFLTCVGKYAIIQNIQENNVLGVDACD